MEEGVLRPETALVVRSGRIEAVLTATEALGWRKRADVVAVSGGGAYVVPGYVDSHCHLGASPEAPWRLRLPNDGDNMERLLFSGVTTVFDPGDLPSDAFARRAAVRTGARVGPTIYATGPLFTAPEGHPIPMIEEAVPGWAAWWITGRMTRAVRTPDDAAAMVAELSPARPDFIKVVVDSLPLGAPKLDAERVTAVVQAARAHGIRTVAHIGRAADARLSGDAGVSAWVHGVYKEPLSAASVAALARYQIPMVPTIVVFESYATLGRAAREPTALEQACCDPDSLKALSERPPDFHVSKASADTLALVDAMRAASRRNVAMLHRAGVRILTGSDAQNGVFHGPGLHREFALLASAGLSPTDVLRGATVFAAQFLEDTPAPSFGVVRPGARADLVFLGSNPLDDVAALSDIVRVMHRGMFLVRHGRVVPPKTVPASPMP